MSESSDPPVTRAESGIPATGAGTGPASSSGDATTTFPPAGNRSETASLFILFILVIAGAIALRAFSLGDRSYWADEFYSMEAACGWGHADRTLSTHGLVPEPPIHYANLSDARPWWTIAPKLADDDNHPPLYFIVLRFWMNLFGQAEVPARSLSVIFSIAAIILFFMMVRELNGTRSAFWAATIMAVASPQIEVSQEVRNYMPMLALCLGAGWALARLEKRGASIGAAAALGICVLCMLLTHYLSAPIAVALFIYAVVFMRRAARTDAVIAIGIAVLIFAAVWGWAVVMQHNHNYAVNNEWISDNTPGQAGRAFSNLAMLPLRMIMEVQYNLQALTVAPYSAILWLLIPLAFLRKDLRLWGLWLLLGVGSVLVADLHGHEFHLQFPVYTLMATPALYALIAAILPSDKRWTIILPAAAVVAALYGITDDYRKDMFSKLDWRPAIARAFPGAKDGDGLIISADQKVDTDFDFGITYLAISYYDPIRFQHVAFESSLASPETMAVFQGRPVWIVWDWQRVMAATILPGMQVLQGSMPISNLGLVMPAKYVRPPISPAPRPQAAP